MSNTFGFVSEDTFATKMDEQNRLLAAIAANGGESLRPTNWQGVQAIVRAGMASKIFSIGDQFVCKRGNDTLVWDVIGFDHDTPVNSNLTHSMTLLMHDCYKKAAFDVREAFYATSTGLNAGNYKFTIGTHPYNQSEAGKTYYFTLTNNVPEGGQLLFKQVYDATLEGAHIESYAGPSNMTPIENVTLTSVANSQPSNLGTIGDSIQNGFNSIHRSLLGNSNWKESNIRQYLNSNAPTGSIFAAQNEFDRTLEFLQVEAGFMNGIDPEFLAVVGEVEKTTEKNTVFEDGGYYTTRERFFLVSREEIYGGRENSINEGGAYSYFSALSSLSNAGTGADANRVKYYNGVVDIWWLRTPTYTFSALPHYVTKNGGIAYSGASNPYCVIPACNIV